MLKITLIATVFLSSCANVQYKRAYEKAYADRECNHSHICCDFGCACCGPDAYKQRRREMKKRIKHQRKE